MEENALHLVSFIRGTREADHGFFTVLSLYNDTEHILDPFLIKRCYAQLQSTNLVPSHYLSAVSVSSPFPGSQAFPSLSPPWIMYRYIFILLIHIPPPPEKRKVYYANGSMDTISCHGCQDNHAGCAILKFLLLNIA